MLSAMKSLACVGTLLALSTPAAFAEQKDAQQKDAQQKECFTIAMTNATTGGSLGSILLDKCTGNSWVLARTRLGYEPAVGPEEGLRATIEYFRARLS